MDKTLLSALDSVVSIGPELEKALQEPTIQKRFAGNVHLLLGLQNMAMAKLAALASCSPSTLSRMLMPEKKTATKFHKVNPIIFASIAKVLGVQVNTLLFIDLRSEFLERIKHIEEEKAEQ